MKKKITKAQWEKLSDEMKALYNLVGANYILQVEDDDDDTPPSDPDAPAGSKLALERKHRKAAEKRANDAEAALEALQSEKETATNTATTMKTAHDKKVAKLEKERDDAILLHKNFLADDLVGKAASDVAGKLTKSPKVLLPHITARLSVNHDGDEPVLVVLDAKGKVSAATLDDLTKEFRDNKEFAGIVTVSQASGGGASRPGVTAPVGSAPAPGSSNTTETDLNKLRGGDLVAAIKAKREAKAAAQAA